MRDQMETENNSLTVVDVYDIAESLGKEFQKIIDKHGPETVTEVMPKVITALEHLEYLSNRNEKENAEIADLRFNVDKLQSEKVAKAEEREKYENEIEQIEESWRNEVKELESLVSRLQEDNRKLKSSLCEQDDRVQREENDYFDEVGRLKLTVHQQRDQLRAAKRDLTQKNVEIDGMQSQIERLVKLNANYRRKTCATQRQSQNLIQDKTELEVQLHQKDQQITRIHHTMKQDSIESPSSPISLENQLELEGKMVIDLNDPERPRFTMNELRDVLQERNELKTKVMALEEELQFYKPVCKPEEEIDDFDAPVHGPINREPDDKLDPPRERKQSGVRKFFGYLVSPGRSRKQGQSPPGLPLTRFKLK